MKRGDKIVVVSGHYAGRKGVVKDIYIDLLVKLENGNEWWFARDCLSFLKKEKYFNLNVFKRLFKDN